ncbi:TVP38/TMEM64 family protein [Algoriphagus chordae]|uniref:TVP38/TMEM64 family membrane protein n=1 Tax=Algoriphagus chordae TaxID=237019 RepID=A0A2W7QYD7_9BACT|nr:TVP38/TMEM64 family protein [Algoriphagus chordae]PZX51040.1 putative membrane protein YdjX (TVP38/TMEM64 family) [Algoriphagus chordae]
MKESKFPVSKKSRTPLYLSILLISVLVVCYFTIPPVNHFLTEAWNVLTSDDEAQIETWVEGFGWFGPFLIIVAMVLQMFLLIIPSILLMIAAIFAYGPIWGAIISLIAVGLASTVGYVIGRLVGSTFVTRLLGEKTLKKVSSFIESYGFWAVIITRINPFLSNDAISFVTGILKMNYWKFLAATLAGITPLILLIAITGKNTNTLKSGLLWGSIACLVIFAGHIFWDKRKERKHN